jgi:hypothetical protein
MHSWHCCWFSLSLLIKSSGVPPAPHLQVASYFCTCSDRCADPGTLLARQHGKFAAGWDEAPGWIRRPGQFPTRLASQERAPRAWMVDRPFHGPAVPHAGVLRDQCHDRRLHTDCQLLHYVNSRVDCAGRGRSSAAGQPECRADKRVFRNGHGRGPGPSGWGNR